MAPVIN